MVRGQNGVYKQFMDKAVGWHILALGILTVQYFSNITFVIKIQAEI